MSPSIPPTRAKSSQTRVDTARVPENHSPMHCCICGSKWADFYSKGPSVNGAPPEIRAYCEPCFIATFGENDPMITELRERRRMLREKEIDEKIARDRESLRTHLRPKLEEIIAKNPRFPFEAYEFIYASLTRAVHGIPLQPGERSRHATAAEFVRACEEQALHTWGAEARTRTQALGLATSSDIGDIVFLLVENGCLGKRDSDQRTDFDGLPFLNETSP